MLVNIDLQILELIGSA